MADKTYRFLLRMPDHLRGRLVASAKREGRSLNSELVKRLEWSLDEEQRAAPVTHKARRPGALFRHLEGRGMSPKHVRLGLSVIAVLGLIATAVVAAVVQSSGSDPSAARTGLLARDGKMPALLQKKQSIAARTRAAVGSLEEGRGYAAEQWFQDAYPATDIPLARILGARNAFKALKARSVPGQASTGLWTPLGPTRAFGTGENPFHDRTVYTPSSDGRVEGGRTTDVAIDPNCSATRCRMWIATASGGVWRTNNALAAQPTWKFLSGTFEIQSTGSITMDPHDPTGNTLWVGTGEFNSCGSGCIAGVGIYKTTDGGDSWTGPLGTDAFHMRGVSTIAIDRDEPNTIYAGSGRAILGISETCCAGVVSAIPGAPRWGLYKSTNGGQSWTFIHNGTADESECTLGITNDVNPCSPRGVRRVETDPNDPDTLYASSLARGIWRSKDNGETWEQIMPRIGTSTAPTATTERAEFDVVRLANGETRMYVGVGGIVSTNPAPPAPPITFARVRRNDAVLNTSAATAQGAWVDLTGGAGPLVGPPGAMWPGSVTDPELFSSWGYCDGQCIYDNYIIAIDDATDDKVYLGGDNAYDENNSAPDPRGKSNGRGVAFSDNADEAPGVAYFTDMTEDNADDIYPNHAHPDHHRLAINPNNYRQFFDVGDGGVTRSNGVFVDDSNDCSEPVAVARKNYTGSNLAFCQLVLSRVPERLAYLNTGLRTLQPYNITYNPTNLSNLAFGTQDNGTWETLGDTTTWINTNVADGGPPLFDSRNPNLSQSAFQVAQTSTSYSHLDEVDQNWTADTLATTLPYGLENRAFIAPSRADPIVSERIWIGMEHVFRSNSFGSHLSIAKHRQHCNIWFGDGDVDENGVFEPQLDICDDWKPLGDPGPAGRLTNTGFGADRIVAGGNNYVSQVERARGDLGTLWATTSGGRVFVSKNANAVNPASVTFTRIDTLSTVDPNRHPSAIYVDPRDANHAFISYSGFSADTPSTPGHIFEVRYNPGAGTATWTRLDGSGAGAYGDIPANDVVRDEATGNLYVATDYGVVKRVTPSADWIVASQGIPSYPISDLEIVQSRRIMYVAAFGGGAWQLKLG